MKVLCNLLCDSWDLAHLATFPSMHVRSLELYLMQQHIELVNSDPP